jgi:hypothetical protein
MKILAYKRERALLAIALTISTVAGPFGMLTPGCSQGSGMGGAAVTTSVEPPARMFATPHKKGGHRADDFVVRPFDAPRPRRRTI